MISATAEDSFSAVAEDAWAPETTWATAEEACTSCKLSRVTVEDTEELVPATFIALSYIKIENLFLS
jgi:hypothetical protein